MRFEKPSEYHAENFRKVNPQQGSFMPMPPITGEGPAQRNIKTTIPDSINTVPANQLSELTKQDCNWLPKKGCEGKSINLCCTSSDNGTLPFLEVSFLRTDTSHQCYVQQLSLLDSASSRSLIDQKFLKSKLPNQLYEKTNCSLQLACSEITINIFYKTSIELMFQQELRKIKMNLEFLVVPELANEVTLGLDFLWTDTFIVWPRRKFTWIFRYPNIFPLKTRAERIWIWWNYQLLM